MPIAGHPGDLHKSVLLREVLEFLNPAPGTIIVDCTVGTGGHAEAILTRLRGEGLLIGLDQDVASLRIACARLEPFGTSAKLLKANFKNLGSVLAANGIQKVDGIMMDLGMSSFQLESAERGFSFLREGPLDMRIDQEQDLRAFEIVNRYPQDELADIIATYGEERHSREIARRITLERAHAPIETTTQLAGIIKDAFPKKRYFNKIHPATRTFQALRILVNRELDALTAALDQCPEVLNRNGRVCIMAFHSLEDRLVKDRFRIWKREGLFTVLTKHPIRPSREERMDNPRSRSARLRAAEKR